MTDNTIRSLSSRECYYTESSVRAIGGVAKVHESIELCDRLEISLVTDDTKCFRLLGVLLHTVLTLGDEPAEAALCLP